jgi:uncharacterized membrane protein YsdA (DUF1294 family)
MTEKQLLLFLVLFSIINFWSFLVMMIDKIKSKKIGSERISEGMMFFMASIFGSIGVYAGMFIFHHKTSKWYFLLGIPLLIIQNIATFFLLFRFLS